MEDSGLVQANEQLEMAQRKLREDGDGIWAFPKIGVTQN